MARAFSLVFLALLVVSVVAAIPDVEFTQDGQTYVISVGDIYEVKPTGERTFVQHFYDPNFYANNYVENNTGQIYQVDPDSRQMYPVIRQLNDGFNSGPLVATDRWSLDNTDQAHEGDAGNYYALGNRITLSTMRYSGARSARFLARHSAASVSKASLMKSLMFFRKGDHVYCAGWFYLASTPSVYDGGGTTFLDLESSFMQNVGIRLIVRTGDALAFELELPKTDLRQDAPVRFQTGRWNFIKTHLYLSDTDGVAQIWQNGVLVLNKTGRTLPVSDTVYDRIELGVTALAKGARYDKVLYVDGFQMSHTPL